MKKIDLIVLLVVMNMVLCIVKEEIEKTDSSRFEVKISQIGSGFAIEQASREEIMNIDDIMMSDTICIDMKLVNHYIIPFRFENQSSLATRVEKTSS